MKYQGDRSKKDLRRFVMEHVQVEVVDLWDGNLKEMTTDAKKKKQPWLVSYCGGDDEEEDGSEVSEPEIVGFIVTPRSRVKS